MSTHDLTLPQPTLLHWISADIAVPKSPAQVVLAACNTEYVLARYDGESWLCYQMDAVTERIGWHAHVDVLYWSALPSL